MKKPLFLLVSLIIGLSTIAGAQSMTERIDNVEVSETTAKFLGKSQAIKSLLAKPPTTKARKTEMKRMKKVPDNFKGRRIGGKAVHADLEHQGPDPLRQTNFGQTSTKTLKTNAVEPLINIDGLSVGSSPHDPSGDVSDQYYVQAINVTTVGVYDLDGNLVQSFAMNTLWAEFNAASAGDPIILYDENADKWIITEFTDPANVLIAISDTNDPLGSYNAYSFSTPNFPDYPKYSISPNALVITTNEGGPGTLHNYFIDLAGLYAAAANVTMIRVGITGNTGTEAGFYVSTPVDWNGTNMPYDDRPIAVAINDSSWPGGPAQDQIEVYAFNLDFDTPNNTTVDQTSIITTPFDSYPCSDPGFGFSCIPQLDGTGLDAVPEVIMNIPHLRNFGTHESMVFNFVTDVTDGDNLSGIRWVELRRTATTDWALYQEGTFSLDDGLDRFMGSIAIDGNGAIGMAYNVSSAESHVGIRFTGRFPSDPLGVMSVEEVEIIDGSSPINSFGRFGDYSQMSVTPQGDNTFWFTTEYATANDAGTRIIAFKLSKDTFDLSAQAIIEPVTSDALGANELVTARIVNTGLAPMVDFELGFLLDNGWMETTTISDTLYPEAMLDHQFTMPIDLSTLGDYNITAYVNHPDDQNAFNDTISVVISKIPTTNGGIESAAQTVGCENAIPVTLTLSNLGNDIINTALIDVVVNGMSVDNINYNGAIAFNETDELTYTVLDNLQEGTNTVEFLINTINGNTDDFTDNNTTAINFDLMDIGSFVTLEFNTDNFPTDNEWTLTNSGTGAVIASGAFDGSQTGIQIIETICLPLNACYTLRVTDSFGDGMCCNQGDGNFSVFNNENELLLSNDGNFGSVAEEDFCPNGVVECMVTATVSIEYATGPTVADGSIMITAANGTEPYQYSIDGGVTLQDSPLFENLLPEDYDIVVLSDEGNCSYEETVTVDFSINTYEVNGEIVEVKVLPNPTQGVFKVIIYNLKSSEPLLDFEIFDVSGKLIQRRVIGKYNDDYVGTLSLYDYPSGSYFLRIINKDANILEKIIKSD